ncbi:MAG: helix-turn-helix domain-containing protein [Deltaproteobacteria bacterium]|nr:helix-turn-helix domain-containing protein [Deltaproteobacteria bacterium]
MLSQEVFDFLSQIAKSPTSEHRFLERCRIILAAADGVSDSESARRMHVDVQRISRWRRH